MDDLADRLRAALAGRYTVQHELGRGGMAHVFLAHDAKHDRRVAIKVLKPELAQVLGPDRFLREIRLTAQIDHPHILPLLDSGEADGLLYYVMPYVEGETLRDRLNRDKQLPLDDALQIARAVADALSYAHSRGIVHRDVKPENILLAGGHARVADFGIARALTVAGGETLTETGITVGTPAYMSPEQGAGEKEVDGRSDVYSLGCVLYEMLAGHPPFTGATIQELRARHSVDVVPSLAAARPTVSEDLERAIVTALAKVPADRFRTAADFSSALRAPAAVSSPRVAGHRVARAAVAVLAVAVSGIFVVRTITKPPRSPHPTRRQLTFSGNAQGPAISPDGRFLAYVAVAGNSRYVVVADVTGGVLDTVFSFSSPSAFQSREWSPDGTRLLLGGARRALVLQHPRGRGGPPREFEVATRFRAGVYASWLPDGSRVSLHDEASKRIVVVDVATEDTLSIPVGGTYLLLMKGSWSPDGRRFAVTTESAGLRWQIRVVTLGGQTELLIEDSVPLNSPRWSHDGDAVYYVRDSDAIWRVPVSPRTARWHGAPEEIHPQIELLQDAGFRRGGFSVTRDGHRMVYAKGVRFSNIWLVEGIGQQPRTTALTSGTALRWSPVVSPDGSWIAFAQNAHTGAELFRMPLGGGAVTQITSGAGVSLQSKIAWSPDGSRIAFESARAGRSQVWIAWVESGRLQVFDRTEMRTSGDLAWAPGAHIAYTPQSYGAIRLVDPESEGERSLVTAETPLVLDPVAIRFYDPQYSPDGNRLAVFLLNPDGGGPGLWIFDLRDSSRTRVGAGQPFGWSADGRHIYARTGQTITRVDARQLRAAEPILTLPFREAECTPAGPRRLNALVCAASDFNSDVWMIENFEPGGP